MKCVDGSFSLQTELNDGKIADLAFFRDALVMAVNNQSVFVMNTTTSLFTKLPNTHGVLSVAVDWLTHRLFWANPHRQMVSFVKMILPVVDCAVMSTILN